MRFVNYLGCEAPLRPIQSARISKRPRGVFVKLLCGHERFHGGPALFSASELVNVPSPCMSCVPLQNDMGVNPSW